MPTSNMSLNEPTVGTTAGPTWATETNSNWSLIDAHDHTSGKGTQLGPSALNINADLEFNQNSATELKNLIFDSSVTAASTNYSVYQAGGNLYWRNNSGAAVQITDGGAVKTSGGSISGMSSTAVVLFSSNSYAFKFDVASSVGMNYDGMAKMSFADIDLYKYLAAGSNAKVTLKFLGSGTSAVLTVPDETGTLLSTSTNFAGTINIATSSSNAPIILKPNGTGHVTIGNGGATGKLTSNGAYDLILDTNGGTNSGSITITDGANGEITIDTHGTGDINLTAGADVNIPADIGLTFGDDGEKIEGDGTDLSIASSNKITVSTGAVVDAVNFDSNTLSIDASNNRCGVGTAAPDSKLHVEGTDPGSGNALIEAKLTANSNNPCIQIINENTGGNSTDNHGLLIDNRGGAGDSYSIRVKNNTTENFYVRGDGKIYFGGVIQSDIETTTTTKVKQMGAFLQSSTHQSLALGY